MNIKIVLNQPYPHGMACTNRIHHYAKGLIEQGHKVEIIIPMPLEQKENVRNLKPQGTYDNVKYHYSTKTTIRSSNFIIRRIQDNIGPILAAINFFKEKERPDALLLVSNYLYHIILFKIAALFRGTIYIQEKSEFPFVFKKKSSVLINIYRKLLNNTIYKLFDGILVISDSLYAFFQNKISQKAALLKIPVIVNLDEFTTIKEKSETFIAYSGNLSNHKDGILDLVKSFSITSKKFPNLKFYVVGKGSESDEKKVKKLIFDLNLNDKVILTGYVTRKQLLYYLNQARALVIAKPDTLQSNTCFPSKMGEYLATGNPVISTSVGEIPTYLFDEKNAYLVSPNDHNKFASKICRVLDQPEKSIVIGKEGKKTAEQNFNYKIHGIRISNFIEELGVKKGKNFTHKA